MAFFFQFCSFEKVSSVFKDSQQIANGDIVVRSISKNPLVITMEGSGTIEDPYLINSYDDFKQASYDLSLNYELVNNIDFNDKLPLILGSNNNHFTGNFEGDGYIISNVNLVGYNEVGLFGYSDGTIHGLTILDGEVSGYQHVGVLAGTSKGKVTGTKISGNVSGHSYIGVALGENYSIIEAVVSGDVVLPVAKAPGETTLFGILKRGRKY